MIVNILHVNSERDARNENVSRAPTTVTSCDAT